MPQRLEPYYGKRDHMAQRLEPYYGKRDRMLQRLAPYYGKCSRMLNPLMAIDAVCCSGLNPIMATNCMQPLAIFNSTLLWQLVTTYHTLHPPSRPGSPCRRAAPSIPSRIPMPQGCTRLRRLRFAAWASRNGTAAPT